MFKLDTAEIYVPDGLPVEEALTRTTHLCLAAHQDDIEIMAAAQIMLDYPSKIIKEASNLEPVSDLVKVLRATHPKVIYTHNLADKHDTHVAVALRVIAAIRQLSTEERPEKLYGCEVWRGLDWLVDSDKVGFDTSEHESLQAALVGVFDSQIAGGKRYDLATMGRRKANATYFQSHGVDASLGITYGMDLTPLVSDPSLDAAVFIQDFIQCFAQDVAARFRRIS